MKIVCFGDTHCLHHQITIPDGDILIFAGDLMNSGYVEYEIVEFLYWFSKFPHKHKVFIAGNHDRYFENYPVIIKENLSYYPGIKYLENSGTTIEEINIYGTPDTHHFCGWAFNRSDDQLTDIYSKIPDNTDILISHGPPYGALDTLVDGKYIGEVPLRNRIEELKNLKYNIFGHIHDNKKFKNNGSVTLDGVTYINCSIVDDNYDVVNKPIIFNYE